jgi:LysR family transcriptional regulator, low CO2-responsive transcriptional regulator
MQRTTRVGEFHAADLQGLKRGVLRIAGVSTTEYFLANMLKAFVQKYPQIEIDLAIENRQAVITRLQRDDDDLAVMMMPPAQLPLQRFPFMENPLVAVAAIDHPWASKRRIALATLAAEPLLTREVGSGTRLAVETLFADHGHVLFPRMTLGSNEAVKHAAASGLGVAILSRHAIAQDPSRDGLTVLRVVGFPLKRMWQLVWHSDRALPLPSQAFVEFVKQQVGQGTLSPGAR